MYMTLEGIIKLKNPISSISIIIFTVFLIISNGYCENTPYVENSSVDSLKGPFSLQVGIFLQESAAEKKVIELKNKGYEPFIFQTLNSKNQIAYAVRIGKYNKYGSADLEASKFQSETNSPVKIAFYESLETVEPGERTPASEFVANGDENKSHVANPPEVFPKVTSNNDMAIEDEADGTPSLEDLQKRIKSLESTINMLKDETEVRKQLQVTDEEAKAEEKDILEAAGQEYTLTKAGNIQFSYGFGYSYQTYDAIRQSVQVEDVADHTITNSFGVSYGIRDNFSLGAGIPFIYAYSRVGTVNSRDVTDLGDLGLNWQLQPFKTASDMPTIILNGGFTIPTGRDPYEIEVGEELSTGSGIYQTSLGVSVSQVSDPVVVFSSFSFNLPLTVTDINQKRPEGILMEVDPGNSLGLSVGMGYALSYKLNLNASVGYSYAFETAYKYENAPEAKSGTSASASMGVGVGYKISKSQNLNFRFGIPITESREFSFSLSTPIEFEL
jgi:hypothetical protein